MINAQMRDSEIHIITGIRDAGKTYFCIQLNQKLRAGGIRTSGMLSIGKFKNGKKILIYAKDIDSGIEKRLAGYKPGWDPTFPKRDWYLDDEAINWANKKIQNSVPTDVLFIDELGYLEFEKQKGWASSFQILKEGKFGFAFVVVRPGFLQIAVEMIETSHVIHIDQTTNLETLSNHYAELVLT